MSTGDNGIEIAPTTEEILRPGNEITIETEEGKVLRLDVLRVVEMPANARWLEAHVRCFSTDRLATEYDIPLTGPGSDSLRIAIGEPLELVPSFHAGGNFRLHRLGMVASISICTPKNT